MQLVFRFRSEALSERFFLCFLTFRCIHRFPVRKIPKYCGKQKETSTLLDTLRLTFIENGHFVCIKIKTLTVKCKLYNSSKRSCYLSGHRTQRALAICPFLNAVRVRRCTRKANFITFPLSTTRLKLNEIILEANQIINSQKLVGFRDRTNKHFPIKQTETCRFRFSDFSAYTT